MIRQRYIIVINANAQSQLHILGTDHQFLENSWKNGDILHWKKRRLSEYVTMVINNLFSNDFFFKSLIEIWLIYHKEKELNDFGLEIRI